MHRSTAWAFIAISSFAGCEGDPFSPDLGPARAQIEITVEGPQGAPVEGAAVSINVYGGEFCDAGELVGAAEAVTDQRGQASMLIEAVPEASGRVTCSFASIEPPLDSDLQAVDVSFGRLLLASETYVPDPPLVRYFVTLQRSTSGAPFIAGR